MLGGLIDEMHNKLPALIGKCEITRAGIKQIVVWPTGVVNKPGWDQFSINPAKRAELKPVRRDEIKPAADQRNTVKPVFDTAPIVPSATAALEETFNMKTANKSAKSANTETAEKSKVLRILEYIEANPDSHGHEIRKAAGTGINLNSYIPGYIKRGEVIKTSLHDFDSTYRLADGLKAADIYKHGKRGPAGDKNSPQAGVATSQSESVAKPVALQNSPEAQAALISLGGDDQHDAQGSASTSESTAQPSYQGEINHELPYSPFRVAYTSDGCLLIYGLQIQAIELNKDQKTELFEFVGPQLNLVPQ